jgi:hypothetical protein
MRITADAFYRRWRSEFFKVGGIHSVKYRRHEPGDIVGLDVNINDELLLWDPKFSKLEREIQRIQTEITENEN